MSENQTTIAITVPSYAAGSIARKLSNVAREQAAVHEVEGSPPMAKAWWEIWHQIEAMGDRGEIR